MWNSRVRRQRKTIEPVKLPVELIDAVVNLVYGKRELYYLCLTSRMLRSIAEPMLYQFHFGRSNQAEADIRILLSHPRFETIVNTIFIELDRWEYCRKVKWDNSRTEHGASRIELSPPPCSCDELDSAVGRALNDLLNLRVLRLECTLCHDVPHDRHGYLLTLKTRSLKEIRVNCVCTPEDETDANKLVEILTAPCMESVTTFDMFTQRTNTLKGETLEPFFKDAAILPNLRHLNHRYPRPIAAPSPDHPTEHHRIVGYQSKLQGFKEYSG
ncbi:hypothetical protein CPB86DRAFT_795117 [Serendipita vermifera]|nr:hypothetical protein CPB86DRAFT_795117 [Serendipita vermifera]